MAAGRGRKRGSRRRKIRIAGQLRDFDELRTLKATELQIGQAGEKDYKNLRWRYKKDGDVEFVEDDDNLNDDDIVFGGSKSDIRRIEDLERNMSILATKVTTTDGAAKDDDDDGFGSVTSKKTRFKETVRFSHNVQFDSTATENIEDLVGNMAGTGISYTDGTGTLNIGQAVGTGDDVEFKDLTLSGDLTVNGTTTTINTATLSVSDNMVVLNKDVSGTPTENSGIEIRRGTSTNAKLQWNESNDYWEITAVGNTGKIVTSNDAVISLNGTGGKYSNIGTLSGSWNSTEVAKIQICAGQDASNQDDGSIKFYTSESGGSLVERLEIERDGDFNLNGNNLFTSGKLYYANMFATEGDLPSATTYHGMFAHVHATGAGYFAHNGNWIKLANNSDIPTVPTNISDFTNDAGYVTTQYANSNVDSHINVSSAGGGQVLSWTGSDYAWVTRGTSNSDTTYTAGDGLSLSGTQFSVNGDLTGTVTAIGRPDVYVSVISDAIDFYANRLHKFRMEADGDFHADGNVVAYSSTTSDPRLKENITPVENALEKLEKLTGYTFDYKKDGKASAGVLSTEVEQVLPSAVQHKKLPLKADDDTEYGVVEYDQLTAILIEAVKELSAKVKELENGSSK